MKRHEVLAALAAAAGLTFAIPAQAGIASSAGNTVMPVIETLTDLQQQVTDSDQALSQMIHLAKAQGHDRSGKGKSDAARGPSRGNSEGKGHESQGKGKGHDSHGKGKGKGHGKGHNHPS